MRLLTTSRCGVVIFTMVVALLVAWNAADAQGSGTLMGRVVDSKTGDALAGANLVILNTTMGTAADIEGRYAIRGIPAGKWTVRASMIGYVALTRDVAIVADSTLTMTFALDMQTIEGKEVVVTAQALGQQSAIEQQLGSKNIVNVVSSARIQELPDANAAESVGRLPGVSLLRSGGEATQVVIRGLQPQYNSVTVDGVSLSSNDGGSVTTSGIYATPTNTPGGRAVDLSMISSSSLEGIEVYKTMTPDMDAAVLGGTVNFTLREARGNGSGGPTYSLLAQGGYNDLMSAYNVYKFVGSAEQRFLDDNFGVLVQGIAQKQNLTSDQLGGVYYALFPESHPNDVSLGSLVLTFAPTDQRRYDGTVTLDYRLPNGKITLLNLVSYGKSTNESHSETYDLAGYGNDVQFGTQLSTNQLHVATNILEFDQSLGAYQLKVKLSNSYSDNRTPNGWRVSFQQLGATTTGIPSNLDPQVIARLAQDSTKTDQMYWAGNSTWSSFNKQNDMQGSVDLETNVQLSDLMSVTLKAGGQYKYTTRYYNFDDGFGNLFGGNATGFRLSIVQDLPWLTKAPYNFDPTGNLRFPMLGFFDPHMNFGKFLKGDYAMYSGVTTDALDQIMNAVKGLGAAITQPQTVPSYTPDLYSSIASDYSGNEFRSAEYLMGTLNIGPSITIMAGVRYQGLKTTYTAAHFDGNADATNPYPFPLNYTEVTKDEYHGYWLPDFSVKYDPLEWLTFRASYSSTLAYPDFSMIVPRQDVSSNSGHFVVWNNFALNPARSQNYDFQVAVHDNTVGLLAVNPFLKRIYDQLFNQQTFISDPSRYPGLPSYTKTFSLSTYINNPNRVDVYGVEAEWQTHFWYLPGVLSGIVLNVNYTHIFSSAYYPYSLSVRSPVYPFPTVHIDTSYNDRLIQQPNDIVNLSIGFDYAKFSILASMIYQAQVYSGTNFLNSLRSDKTKYLRWDLSVKQGLPVPGLEVFLDVNDLNSEADIYNIRGSGFPTSESNYGLTADLGIRWTPE